MKIYSFITTYVTVTFSLLCQAASSYCGRRKEGQVYLSIREEKLPVLKMCSKQISFKKKKNKYGRHKREEGSEI